MEEVRFPEKMASNDRLQNMLKFIARCKIDYRNITEDSKNMREINLKLETELKQAREQQKLHQHHLLVSREMISNLQETVSQLVYLKRETKELKENIASKDVTIAFMEREKDCLLQNHNENVEGLRKVHKQEMEELSTKWEKNVQQIQYDCDTQTAQFTCVIEELRNKLRDTDAEHKEKMNALVLEYEEKVQRSMAQAAHLQEQLSRQAAHTDVNIEAYRRKLEELEEKLKQQQFKNYLAQSNYTAQHENRVERPYSVERDQYAHCGSVDYNPVTLSVKELSSFKNQPSTKNQKAGVNTLQVIYQDNTNAALPNANEKKFNLTKKRKLYNEKDFLNM